MTHWTTLILNFDHISTSHFLYTINYKLPVYNSTVPISWCSFLIWAPVLQHSNKSLHTMATNPTFQSHRPTQPSCMPRSEG